MILQHKTLLITRNTEHHIERYSNLPNQLTDYLQYVDCSIQFFTKKLSTSFDLPETANFLEVLHNEYGVSDIDEYYTYLSQSNFSSFFKDNYVDIPSCFGRSKSLLNKQNSLPLLKFTNFLMRHGKKLQMSTLLMNCISDCLLTYRLPVTTLNTKN